MMMWGNKMPTSWNEVRRMTRAMWLFDNMSKGGSSASGPQLTSGNWKHRKWNHG